MYICYMIIRSNIARISIFAVLLLCVLWVATPQVYIHKLFDHQHELVKTNGETSVQNEANADCEIDKYNTPLYFTIFKFINNFIPLKPKHEAVLVHPTTQYNSFIKELDSSRAPPIA